MKREVRPQSRGVEAGRRARGWWPPPEGTDKPAGCWGCRAQDSEDSSPLHVCSGNGRAKAFPTGPSSFANSGPVFTAVSVPCLIFTADQKKTKQNKNINFTVVGRTEWGRPSPGRRRPLPPTRTAALRLFFSHLARLGDFLFDNL